jgi:hypothetical protein
MAATFTGSTLTGLSNFKVSLAPICHLSVVFEYMYFFIIQLLDLVG